MKLPLDVGTRVECKWLTHNHQYHMVRIIERRPVAGATSPTEFDYYVHYVGCGSHVACHVLLGGMYC